MRSPIYVIHLANVILEMIKNNEFKEAEQTKQVYHYSNEGATSWYGVVQEVFKLAEIDCKVGHITTEQYQIPTKNQNFFFILR